MSLSDGCFDFVHALDEGKPVEEAASEFLEGIEYYLSSESAVEYLPYPIEALRQAARAVPAGQSFPGRMARVARRLRARLLRLAADTHWYP
jgi:hypothetical protein